MNLQNKNVFDSVFFLCGAAQYKNKLFFDFTSKSNSRTQFAHTPTSQTVRKATNLSGTEKCEKIQLHTIVRPTYCVHTKKRTDEKIHFFSGSKQQQRRLRAAAIDENMRHIELSWVSCEQQKLTNCSFKVQFIIVVVGSRSQHLTIFIRTNTNSRSHDIVNFLVWFQVQPRCSRKLQQKLKLKRLLLCVVQIQHDFC